MVFGTHPAALWAAGHLLSFEKKVLLIPLADPGNAGIRAIPRGVLDAFHPGESARAGMTPVPVQILTSSRRFKIGDSPEAMARERVFQFGSSRKPGDDPELMRGLRHVSGVCAPGFRTAWSWEESVRTVLSLVQLDPSRADPARMMVEALVERGAHLAKPGQLRRIFVDQNTFVGVQLGDRSKMISALAGFNGARSETLAPLMSEGGGAPPAAAGWWFEMRFECEASAVPAGVTRRMIHVEGEAPVLEFHREGEGVFVMRTVLPLDEASLDRGFQRRLCERMMKVASRIIPDLEYNVRKMVPDLRDVERAERFELPSLFPYRSPGDIPAARKLAGKPSEGGVRQGLVNLHSINDEVLPEQGVPGPYRSVIEWFETQSKKRDPMMSIPPLPSRVHL